MKNSSNNSNAEGGPNIPVGVPLTGAVFGPVFGYSECIGDCWTNTWADDGELYSICDDCIFPDGKGSNWAVHKLSGEDPRRLIRTIVNRMAEYGCNGERFGPERYCWKGNSILCMEGVLYASISRHGYPDTKTPDQKQTSQDGSIIKSTDHGKTWSRSMQENLERPMFPGKKFATPFFIQYGKDCSVKAHGSDRFVYAMSNDGYWNNGNTLSLCRVSRDRIGDLNGTDWEFYHAGDGGQDSAWTRDVNLAALLLNEPDRISMSAPAYLPQLQRYILLQWHYDKNHFGESPTTWVLRESPTPWGPWIPIVTQVYGLSTQYYNPCLVAKFIEDDGLRLWIATNGNFRSPDYFLKTMPVTVWTNTSLKLSANHLRFAAGTRIADPPPQTIKVQCGGKAPPEVQVSISGSPSWLAVTREPSDDCVRLINRITASDLAPGDYEAEVVLTAPTAAPSKTSYYVHLTVKQSHDATAVPKTEPGLTYEYFETDKLDKLPDFLKLATENRVCPIPELSAVLHREEYFVLRFRGCFKAPRDGAYTFFVNFDDGCRLTIDTECLIEGDKPFYLGEDQGTVWLRQGLHPIALEYYQGRGIAMLAMSVAPPGRMKRKIEAGDFVHAAGGKGSPKIVSATVADLEKQVNHLRSIAPKAHGLIQTLPCKGTRYVTCKYGMPFDDGELGRRDLKVSFTELMAPIEATWLNGNYAEVQHLLDTFLLENNWWYRVFGWPDGQYVFLLPGGPYANPRDMLPFMKADDMAVAMMDSMPGGEAVHIPNGRATFTPVIPATGQYDLRVWMLSGEGAGPVDIKVDGRPAGMIGVESGKSRIGHFNPSHPLGLSKGTCAITLESKGALTISAIQLYLLPPEPIRVWSIAGNFYDAAASWWDVAANFAKVFPPERNVNLHDTYESMGGKTIEWRQIDIGEDKVIQLLERYYPFDPRKETGLAYLSTWVHSPAERELALFYASDWFMRVWLNGEEIIRLAEGPWPIYAATMVRLKAGWNALLVKSMSGTTSWKAAFALADPGDLKYSPTIASPTQRKQT